MTVKESCAGRNRNTKKPEGVPGLNSFVGPMSRKTGKATKPGRNHRGLLDKSSYVQEEKKKRNEAVSRTLSAGFRAQALKGKRRNRAVHCPEKQKARRITTESPEPHLETLREKKGA